MDSFRFNSSICSTLKVMGSVGKAMRAIFPAFLGKSSWFPEKDFGGKI
jgi:hypothetical protein